MQAEEDFKIICFNEDLDQIPAAELDQYYLTIEQKGYLDLNWKCVGRRAPSPLIKDEPKAQTPVKESPKNLEFDFMDESSPQTSLMRVRNQNTPQLRGSAKKKTTNFAGVIDQMKKHGRLNKDTRPAAGSNSSFQSNANR